MKSKAINKMIIMIRLEIKKSFLPINIKNLLSIKSRGRHSTTDVPKTIVAARYNKIKKNGYNCSNLKICYAKNYFKKSL